MLETPLQPGQRFIRQRLFKPADGGVRRWWLKGVTAAAAEATGSGVKTLGKVAIFRQWVADPDGAEYCADFVPRRAEIGMRSEYSMRQSLGTMHFEIAT
jgi:hypothetical protein